MLHFNLSIYDMWMGVRDTLITIFIQFMLKHVCSYCKGLSGSLLRLLSDSCPTVWVTLGRSYLPRFPSNDRISFSLCLSPMWIGWSLATQPPSKWMHPSATRKAMLDIQSITAYWGTHTQLVVHWHRKPSLEDFWISADDLKAIDEHLWLDHIQNLGLCSSLLGGRMQAHFRKPSHPAKACSVSPSIYLVKEWPFSYFFCLNLPSWDIRKKL